MGSVVVNSKESSEFKLPTNFKPTSYQLDVTTYLEDKFLFEGEVAINVSTNQSDTSHLCKFFEIYLNILEKISFLLEISKLNYLTTTSYVNFTTTTKITIIYNHVTYN